MICNQLLTASSCFAPLFPSPCQGQDAKTNAAVRFCPRIPFDGPDFPSCSRAGRGLAAVVRIPPHHFVQSDSLPAKDVERAADGEIDRAVAQSVDKLEVGETATAAGVRDGKRAPRRESANKVVIDALLQALVVGGVNEELGAERLEQGDGAFPPRASAAKADPFLRGRSEPTLVQLKVGHSLPLVGGNIPALMLASAAQVDDELVLVATQGAQHRTKASKREGGVGEEERGYNDLLHSPSARGGLAESVAVRRVQILSLRRARPTRQHSRPKRPLRPAALPAMFPRLLAQRPRYPGPA